MKKSMYKNKLVIMLFLIIVIVIGTPKLEYATDVLLHPDKFVENISDSYNGRNYRYNTYNYTSFMGYYSGYVNFVEDIIQEYLIDEKDYTRKEAIKIIIYNILEADFLDNEIMCKAVEEEVEEWFGDYYQTELNKSEVEVEVPEGIDENTQNNLFGEVQESINNYNTTGKSDTTYLVWLIGQIKNPDYVYEEAERQYASALYHEEFDKRIVGSYSPSDGNSSRIVSDCNTIIDFLETKDSNYFNSLGTTKEDLINKYEEIGRNPLVGQYGAGGVLGNSAASGNHTIDEVINEGNSFIEAGKNSNKNTILAPNLKTASDTLYNILLTIGIFLAVAIGMYLGIKFMLASAEDKAKVKESLIPYIAACVVIFGGFTIWKLVLTLLGGLA